MTQDHLIWIDKLSYLFKLTETLQICNQCLLTCVTNGKNKLEKRKKNGIKFHLKFSKYVF